MTGKQFKLIRIGMDLSIEELAEKMGLCYDSVRKLEKKPVVRKVCELAILRLKSEFDK